MADPNAKPVIRVAGLRKSYDSPAGSVEVLHGLDFEIRSGEFVAIMGPSGSGKSTMMNILGCLDTASAGVFEMAGHDTAKMSADELAKLRNDVIGFVFQGFNLLSRTTIEDNVALPLVYRGISREARRKAANETLGKVGLGKYGKSRPMQISGGQQQRVAIARALVGKPTILFADEPTGNLDTATSHEVMDLFSGLNRDEHITLVIVTHEPDVAHYADRLIRLVDGLIEYDGPAKAYFQERAA